MMRKKEFSSHFEFRRIFHSQFNFPLGISVILYLSRGSRKGVFPKHVPSLRSVVRTHSRGRDTYGFAFRSGPVYSHSGTWGCFSFWRPRTHDMLDRFRLDAVSALRLSGSLSSDFFFGAMGHIFAAWNSISRSIDCHSYSVRLCAVKTLP